MVRWRILRGGRKKRDTSCSFNPIPFCLLPVFLLHAATFHTLVACLQYYRQVPSVLLATVTGSIWYRELADVLTNWKVLKRLE